MTGEPEMTAAEFAEKYGMTIQELPGLQAAATKATSTAEYTRFIDTLKKNPKLEEFAVSSMRRAYGVASDGGKAALIMHRDAHSFDQLFQCVFCLPFTFDEFPLWVLYHACLTAEQEFARVDCKPAKREEAQSANFLKQIGYACQKWLNQTQAVVNRFNSTVGLSELSLEVQGREQSTGGDFALLIEYRKSREDIPEIIPVVLQSKRFNGDGIADISRKNNTTGRFQFHTLKETRSRCPAGYFFFNNDTQAVTKEPHVPALKDVRDMPMAAVPKTDYVWEKSNNFATFVLHLIATVENEHRHYDAGSALEKIVRNVSLDDLTGIGVVSVETDAGPRFQRAWEMTLQKLRSPNDEPPAPEPTEPPDVPRSRSGFGMGR
ncbi:MAG: hypothetical protein AB7E55_18135 [Pigmentiphaga sp.]